MAPPDLNLYWLRPDRLMAWRGQSLLLTDPHGRVRGGAEGLYVRRTRFLSRLVLRVGDTEPVFVSANPVTAHALTSYHLAPSPAGAAAGPPGGGDDGGEIARKAIEIQVNDFVGGGLHRDVFVTNHAMAATRATLAWEVRADFADQGETGGSDGDSGFPVERTWSSRHRTALALVFRCRQPGLDHATILRFAGGRAYRLAGDAVQCDVVLQPGETRILGIDLAVVFQGRVIAPFHGLDGMVTNPDIQPVSAAWDRGCARLAAGNPAVQAAWDRAAADLGSLHLLEGEGDERFTPAAGVPNYIGLFGRDALMAGWQSALLNPVTLRGTLSLVGRWNAQDDRPEYDAQPGKVLHQRQLSPLALLGKSPFLHYYGDHSAPGLFLLGLASDLAWRGDLAFFRSMRDRAEQTLAWMDRDGDVDSDGFYDYTTRAGEAGLRNQGWKDSGQAILHADGRLAKDPIAVCEIQGLYYAAKQAMALAFAAIGERARTRSLLAQAAALKRRFNDRFWLPEEQYYALALDGEEQAVRSVASNPGACLAYGIVDADKAASVAARLMAPDMFSGWGIRTLSSRHPGFNPLAYHLGTVWPFANAMIAFGLKRYGFTAELHRLSAALFDASGLFHLHRLPEVFGGHARDRRHPHPGVYPDACAPQAWSASAVVLLIQTMLGLVPLAPLGTLIVDPALPDWLPELTLEDVRVGAARVSLRFRRDASGHTGYEVLRCAGALRIHQPAPGGAGDGLLRAVQEVLAVSAPASG